MRSLPLILLLISLFLLPMEKGFSQKKTVDTDAGEIKVNVLASGLNHPWGMDFLPDGRLLVTERSGNLRILDAQNNLSEPIQGVPEVFATGQGGLLDVVLDPDYENNGYIYLSYAEPGDNETASTALGRGKLENDSLVDFTVLFQQEPKVEGPNHFGGRIIFEDGEHIFLTLGERFKFDPAQDSTNHLGTIVRIHSDGSLPGDNPFANDENIKNEIWSYGHRNIEAGAIDPETGNFWIVEMGPLGGDELNLVNAGENYGWPVVSWGNNYDGTEIPEPTTHPEFTDAVIHWTPTISPSGMIFYQGDMFPEWKGSGLIGGLTSSGIVRISVDNENAEEVERIPLTVRVRDVLEAPDGSVYVLTDEDDGKILQLIDLSQATSKN
jgi:aldose sugar dehydrogenase